MILYNTPAKIFWIDDFRSCYNQLRTGQLEYTVAIWKNYFSHYFMLAWPILKKATVAQSY